eukprot:7448608-Pyramimonas_sp.AAC.1
MRGPARRGYAPTNAKHSSIATANQVAGGWAGCLQERVCQLACATTSSVPDQLRHVNYTA